MERQAKPELLVNQEQMDNLELQDLMDDLDLKDLADQEENLVSMAKTS